MIPVETLVLEYMQSDLLTAIFSSLLPKFEIPDKFSPYIVRVSDEAEGASYQFPDDGNLTRIFAAIALGVLFSVHIRMPKHFIFSLPTGMRLSRRQKKALLSEIAGRTLKWPKLNMSRG